MLTSHSIPQACWNVIIEHLFDYSNEFNYIWPFIDPNLTLLGFCSECARLLLVSDKESGAWLRALPVSFLGLRMDDNTVHIAVGLRLRMPVCSPHQCRHCSAEVDELGRHALSCRQNEERHQRHAALTPHRDGDWRPTG